jgi:hypothetical protein
MRCTNANSSAPASSCNVGAGGERVTAAVAEDLVAIAAICGGRVEGSDAADRDPVPPPSIRG